MTPTETTTPSAVEISPEFVAQLLDLPSQALQEAWLGQVGLLHEDGLHELLDFAEWLIENAPAEADRLLRLCADLAGSAGAPDVPPRAQYTQARLYFIKGEFEQAIALIETAAAAYHSLNLPLEALRTNVGLMAVLRELGRNRSALEIGQRVLAELAQIGPAEPPGDDPAPRLLTAMVHQNLGGCYEKMGRYPDALEAYALAEEIYLALAERERLADLKNDRAIILMYLGRVNEALEALTAVVQIGIEHNQTLLQAQALCNVGEAQALLGNYTASLKAFEEARHLFESLDTLVEDRITLSQVADVYLALNLFSEALTAYRQADSLLAELGLANQRGWNLWGLGATLTALADYTAAESILAEAAALFVSAGNVPLLTSVKLEQAALLNLRGERPAAVALVQEALALLENGDWPVQQFYAHMRLADLLQPDIAAAEPHLLAAQHLAERLALPHLRYRLQQRLGQARYRQGLILEAEQHLLSAIDEIEALRGNLAREAMRVSFLRDKTAAYEDLIRLYLDQAQAEQAFNFAERAQSRSLVDLLSGVSPSPGKRAANPERAARLASLQAELNAVYNKLLGTTPPTDESQAPLPALTERATRLEQEFNQLRLRAVAETNTTNPFGLVLHLKAIQARLPADLVLIAYHTLGQELLAFVVSPTELRVVRRLSTVETVQPLLQRLAQQWDRFRAGSEFAGRHASLLQRSVQRLLTTLYTELFAPVEAELIRLGRPENSSLPKLVVMPHGLLHQAPFHAFFDGRHYLLERFEFSYAPSATVFTLCQKRQSSGLKQALVFGLTDRLIPAAVKEAEQVAAQFQRAGLYLNRQATLATLRQQVSASHVLHLACHGMFRVDNPMFSALKLHDGWLTAHEVLGLDLKGTLVTLSACESGRSAVIGGDEIIGLTRAFLGAGASSVVVSQWLVQDETTAVLMAHFYKQLKEGQSPAAALRAAQLALLARQPHPYYWAPFMVVGRR
ncbi:MAG TPA: CHAT domain-containing tetratricopeptide repeat protein [Anaerolineae bacterium]|nr:CHAT domain-containing tetratricopeptide repeat protein [Anaerolineae bacterium]